MEDKYEQESISQMQALAMKKGLDRVTVIMMISTYAAYISNMNSYEYHTNPEKVYEAQMWDNRNTKVA